MREPRDPTLAVLLDLDLPARNWSFASAKAGGQVLVVDSNGGHWMRLVVTVSPEKPHGIDYSLTVPRGQAVCSVEFEHDGAPLEVVVYRTAA